jgi:hypothetical protein
MLLVVRTKAQRWCAAAQSLCSTATRTYFEHLIYKVYSYAARVSHAESPILESVTIGKVIALLKSIKASFSPVSMTFCVTALRPLLARHS